jgi:hypothetical protein
MNLLWYSEVDFAKHIDSGGVLRHYYVMRSTRDVAHEVGAEHFSDPPSPAAWRSRALTADR